MTMTDEEDANTIDMRDATKSSNTWGVLAAGTQATLTAREKRQLAGECFIGVNLDNVDFSQADLRHAVFQQASLRNCDFAKADLRGARFIDCDLRGSRLSGVALGENRFDGSSFDDVRGLSRRDRDYIGQQGGRIGASIGTEE
jgi:uncharacterized protein YjbI with pentapeptide repeats